MTSIGNRSIGRITVQTATTPTWRQLMTVADTVYEVGITPPNVPLVWPGGIANPPGYWSSAAENNGETYGINDCYGGGIYAEDLGAWGAMLLMSTGEDSFVEQITKFDLSQDNPGYSWFQNPGFATTKAQAQSANSDCAYVGVSDSEYAALPAAQRMEHYGTVPDNPTSANTIDEVAWLAAWRTAGRPFPVGWRGWLFWRKPDTFTMGGTGSPWCFRYHANQFLPASFTGTGDSALLVNQHNHCGPFRSWPPAFSQAQPPLTGYLADSEWSWNVWPTAPNRRKFGLHAQNLRTKAWQRLSQWVPDMPFGGLSPYTFSARDDNTKRIWYIGGYNQQGYYADFTGGLSGVTVSSAFDFTGSTETPYGESHGAFVWNDPQGRKLWYWQSSNNPNTLIVYDMTARTKTALSLASRGLNVPAKPAGWPSYYPYVPMLGGYDPVNNKVHFVNNQRGGPMHCHSFVVPSGSALVATNYTVNSRQLTPAAGVSYEAQSNNRPSFCYNERSKFIPKLGVCLMTQHAGKMLAFQPA